MTTKEEKEREKRRLTLGIPRGAPKAVKVFSLTKEGREFLERLWEAFPELRPRPTSIEEPISMTVDETVAHYIHEDVEAESKESFDKVNQLFINAQKRKEAAETSVEAESEPSEKEILEAQKKAEVQDMIHAQELAKVATEARKAESEVIDVGIVGTSLTTKKDKREALKVQLAELGEEE